MPVSGWPQSPRVLWRDIVHVRVNDCVADSSYQRDASLGNSILLSMTIIWNSWLCSHAGLTPALLFRFPYEFPRIIIAVGLHWEVHSPTIFAVRLGQTRVNERVVFVLFQHFTDIVLVMVSIYMPMFDRRGGPSRPCSIAPPKSS